jgi:hypothetical protein
MRAEYSKLKIAKFNKLKNAIACDKLKTRNVVVNLKTLDMVSLKKQDLVN